VLDMGGEEGRDPLEDYRIINQELENYEARLLERPQIVVANKMDLDDAPKNLERFKAAYPDVPVFETMTLIREGLDPVLKKAADLLAQTPPFPLLDEKGEETGITYTFQEKKKDIEIKETEPHVFEISGPKIERTFDIRKLNTEEDYYMFANKMRYMGIDQALRDAGCQDGDTVRISGFEFEFIEN
jgi:GTP-binding protein